MIPGPMGPGGPAPPPVAGGMNPAMQGLMATATQNQLPSGVNEQAPDPASIIQAAIDLSAGQLDGSVPPSPEVQAEILNMLKEALSLMGPAF